MNTFSPFLLLLFIVELISLEMIINCCLSVNCCKQLEVVSLGHFFIFILVELYFILDDA